MVDMAPDPFQVALSSFRDLRGARRVVRQGPLREDLVVDVDCRARAGAEVVVDVLLDACDGGATVSGEVSVAWEGQCRRCLRRVEGRACAEVREVFRRGGGEDDGTYAMTDDHLNLRDMALDSLFSALPLLPLCDPHCRGICPTCGCDRNTTACECEDSALDARWAALDALRSVEASDLPGPA